MDHTWTVGILKKPGCIPIHLKTHFFNYLEVLGSTLASLICTQKLKYSYDDGRSMSLAEVELH